MGLVFVMQGDLIWASGCIWVGGLFDFLDGFAARLLRVKSEIGKQLDSLADMITFGALPAFIMFTLIGEQGGNAYLPYVAFSIAAFSALRLAKFNIDTRQTNHFIGLPTPANAIFISSLPFIALYNAEYFVLLNGPILAAIAVILSALLVAPVGLLSLKFANFTFSDNWRRYLIIAFAISLGILIKALAIPVVILVYILISIFDRSLQ